MEDANWVNRIVGGHRWVLGVTAVAALGALVGLVGPGLKQDYRLEAFVATNDATTKANVTGTASWSGIRNRRNA